MEDGLWIAVALAAGLLIVLAAAWTLLYWQINSRLYPHIVRIFQEKPLFIIPRGQPIEDAEEVSFCNSDGQTLRGLYLRTATEQRRGVILFGLEYGSNRWACVPYCQFLREAGYDVFTFEPRSQADSDKQPGYEPLQWVTNYEVADMKAAFAYLKNRNDADPQGAGFFGLSKGGGAGLLAAANDSFLRCFVTDGIFAPHTTMLPYMRKWVAIYSKRRFIQNVLPDWYYLMFARKALRSIERERRCRFLHLEHSIQRLAGRPLLMIHGEADTYIKPEMAQRLFERARRPKELWLVKGAKHNQSFHVVSEDYKERVLAFFEANLQPRTSPTIARNASLSEEDLSPMTAHQG